MRDTICRWRRRAEALTYAVAIGALTAAWCIGHANALEYREIVQSTGDEVSGSEQLVLHRNGNLFGATDYNTGYVPLLNAPTGDSGLLCVTDTTWNPTGSIVLVERGTCSFVHKGLMGQLQGAIGVVISSGDNTPPDSIITMSRNMSDAEADMITIPVVSISQNDFDFLKVSIIQAALRNETSQANLNSVGLVDDGDTYLLSGSLKLLTFLILALPVLWLGCFLFAYGRRWCAARVNRVNRVRVAASIPLVAFQREAHMTAGAAGAVASATVDSKASDEVIAAPASPAPGSGSGSGSGGSGGAGGAAAIAVSSLSSRAKRRIHNDSCTVCLDDFKVGEMVKVLPCQHAFHAPCIDPWLDTRSDTCPICKQSIIVSAAARNSLCDAMLNSWYCLPCVMCVNRCRGLDDDPNAAARRHGAADAVPASPANDSANGGVAAGAVHGPDRANSSGFQPLELSDEPPASPAGVAADPHIAPSTPRRESDETAAPGARAGVVATASAADALPDALPGIGAVGSSAAAPPALAPPPIGADNV